MIKPIILNAAELPERTNVELKEIFTVLDLPKNPTAATALLEERGHEIRGIALRKTKIDAAFLDAVPALEIISSYSAGLDNVDVEAAKARNIRIETTSHILAEDVANAALGLALAVTRDFVNADAFVRARRWPEEKHYRLGRSISRMKIGMVGLGAIGSAIARRLQALGSAIAYFGPTRKQIDLPYYDDVVRLARDSDMLILTCPLSPATHHLVDATVIDALGPRGYIVNISRGSVIDETALIAALAANKIAGAALDVFEHEPVVPEALIQDRRLVLTPHIGSATEETRLRMADNVVDTLASHFGLAGPRDEMDCRKTADDVVWSTS
ncbi:D-isomer specific 2-hydroxyacid dehydrogenase [Caballeronia arationis]|jgi:lactate dehydrogenase-like 2-hydroxyacid dehydrogenase|uniref:Lactate dehydrogenase n=1 Tax=Caballeronia arationis TaxID=1777142 RepID=A0A7Z7I1V0_9BURK|nr:2-hydroxyacid dehydrogenase [Caballeronia arationis]SAL00574.1 D-isomer specific 2-hydroxyacid dehydrogenase [Caballeronia arationis]SOE53093.1 Lactate dehydrogenase [Caballeronia arationis]